MQLFNYIKIGQLILFVFLATFALGQGKPVGKYINDGYNENNYLIFNSDSTFKYRLAYCLTHDIACGKYKIHNDTILLYYLTDMRDTCCNKEIDAKIHYDSTVTLSRPVKLFYENEKLYMFNEGKVEKKMVMESKPPKSWGYHRKYLIFGQYINNDVYYMITESKVKWLLKKKKTSR
jgi:hypothetical protein